MSHLLFFTNEELLDSLLACGEIADRAIAHELADNIMVIALLRAVDDDLPEGIAHALVKAYGELDKLYG